MSFRLSNFNFCRAGVVALVWLAFVGASGAGEAMQNIEVVPLHGSSMDTNFNQPSASESDSQMFKAWSSMAPRSVQPPPRMAKPLPRTAQSQAEIEREKELLDRRRNWVFMTMEDYASDGTKDLGKDGIEKDDKKSGTAMERYYQRLYDADHAAATNELGKLDLDRMSGRTNLLGGQMRNSGDRIFGDSPFNSRPDSSLLQTVQRGDFSGVFGSDGRSTLPSPEAVRAEAEQKAHMESFKQIWNIGQPAPAPTPVTAPVSAPVDSGPLFGLSAPGMQPARSAIDSGSRSATSTQPAMPEPTINSSRAASRPPHADFSGVPQRPF